MMRWMLIALKSFVILAFAKTSRLTQAEVAARLGISQPAYAKQESSQKLRKSSRERIAAALGITAEQLDF